MVLRVKLFICHVRCDEATPITVGTNNVHDGVLAPNGEFVHLASVRFDESLEQISESGDVPHKPAVLRRKIDVQQFKKKHVDGSEEA